VKVEREKNSSEKINDSKQQSVTASGGGNHPGVEGSETEGKKGMKWKKNGEGMEW
jgi:hypothetical protein